VNLPKERNEVRETRPDNVVISVDAQGTIYWLDSRVAGPDALLDKLKRLSRQEPQPEVQIRGDLQANYAPVGRIVYACQLAGIAKVGFITEPPPRG
jgi:biopolymer transport protein ExbD